MIKPSIFDKYGIKPVDLDVAPAAPYSPSSRVRDVNTPLDLSAIKPKFEEIYLNDALTLDDLLEMSQQRLAGAVATRQQEQAERGERGMQRLENPRAADRSIIDRLTGPQYKQLHEAVDAPPSATKVVPGIGHLTDYDGQAKVMTGRDGTGVSTNEKMPNPNRTIEGMPTAQWFLEAAKRQGADNKYARVENTGKIDRATGESILVSMPVPQGSDAATERVFEAMKAGTYKPGQRRVEITPQEAKRDRFRKMGVSV